MSNPTNLEINVLNEVVEARIRLQNMVIDLTIVREKLVIRIVAPPKIRAKSKMIEEIVMKSSLISRLKHIRKIVAIG